MSDLVDRVTAAIEQRLKRYPTTGELNGHVGWGATPRELAEAILPLVELEKKRSRRGPVDRGLGAVREKLCVPYRCTQGHEYNLRPTVTTILADGRIEAAWPDGAPCPLWVEAQPCPGLTFPVQPLPAVRRRRTFRQRVGRSLVNTCVKFVDDVWSGIRSGWVTIFAWVQEYPGYILAAYAMAYLTLH